MPARSNTLCNTPEYISPLPLQRKEDTLFYEFPLESNDLELPWFARDLNWAKGAGITRVTVHRTGREGGQLSPTPTPHDPGGLWTEGKHTTKAPLAPYWTFLVASFVPDNDRIFLRGDIKPFLIWKPDAAFQCLVFCWAVKWFLSASW